MPHDWPDLPDLLTTVREFLQAVGPRLDVQDRYHALCCVYLLEIAARELGEWQHVDGADEARLRALVNNGDALLPAEAVRELCTDIRAGRHDDRLEDLLEVMLEHVRHKVAVSRPDHLKQDERQDPTQ